MKYYLALAKGIPRVSSKWVQCCKEKNAKIAISELFKLSNGVSKITGTETSHIDPKQGDEPLFSGLCFIVVPVKKQLREDWVPLIHAGK